MSASPARPGPLPTTAPTRAAARLALAALLCAAPPGAHAAEAYGPEPAIAPTAEEAAALDLARARLGGPGGGVRPQVSGALVAAARLLAQEAAAGADPGRRHALRNALARALAYDPAPTLFTARASGGRWTEALARALEPAPATHVGAGVAEAGGERIVVLLASRRGVRLDPFPRAVAVGETATLSGQLRSGLCKPRVFVSLPSGEIRAVEARGSVWFRAAVPFQAPGRHVVEVLAEGPQGPTVAAILAVSAGGAPLEEADAPAPPAAAGTADPARDEAEVLAALDAARARRGLAPLEPDPALAAVARRHSEAMRAAGTLGHVLPGEPGPPERLGRARIGFRRVFENVAQASTALEAHEVAEESPAHLKNMLEPAARRVGIGVAREVQPSGEARAWLTEILVE